MNDSRMAEDNIKAIYNATEWSSKGATITRIAEQMGVAISTASENISKLVAQGLVEHEPYRGINLTETGRKMALRMVRKHRIIETYLCERLGYAWDEVHEEAEVLEHAASDRLIEHMDANLGFPTHDPHGDPIPKADGTLDEVELRGLGSLETGESSVVMRINDDDPALLRYLQTEAGIRPTVAVTVLENTPEAGIMRLEIGERQVCLGYPAVSAILVKK